MKPSALLRVSFGLDDYATSKDAQEDGDGVSELTSWEGIPRSCPSLNQGDDVILRSVIHSLVLIVRYV